MTSDEALRAVREAVAALDTAVTRLRASHGETLGVRRLCSDVERFRSDLAELGPPAPGQRPVPSTDDLEVIPDTPYDESMWSDAESEGYGAPVSRAL